MIKFINPETDHVDADDLVGKYVAKEGIMVFQCYGLPCLVTSVSGKKINRAVTEMAKNEDETHFVLPREDWTKSDYIMLSSVAVICDTPEEAALVMDANVVAIRTHRRLADAMKKEIASIFEDVAALSSEPNHGTSL